MKRYLLSLIGSQHKTNGFYGEMAEQTSEYCGRSKTFVFACFIIIIWLVSGPLFGFSDTWQLVINTGTTIITFLMMFLLQNSHNRDMNSVHAKLDALLVEIVTLKCEKVILMEMRVQNQRDKIS